MPPARSCKLAVAADLSFVSALQSIHSNNIGFLPRVALARSIDQGHTLLIRQDGQPAGYLSWCCTKKGLVRVLQVAIEPELLRTTLGTKVMQTLRRAAVREDCSIIRLSSRSDLPANQFWPGLGFAVTGTFMNATNRGLPLLEWSLQLPVTVDAIRAIASDGRSGRRRGVGRPKQIRPENFLDPGCNPV